MAKTNKSVKMDYKKELDAIKVEFYKFAEKMGDEHGHNSLHLECFPPEYNKKWIMFMKTTQKKIENLLAKVPQGDKKLQLNLILIKAFCIIRGLLGLKATEPNVFVRTGLKGIQMCEELLRPYKNKAEGVWLYVMTEVVHVQLIDLTHTDSYLWYSPKCQNDFAKALVLIEDADKHYKDFVNFQMEKPWGIDDIFCCYDDKGNQLKSKLADDFWEFRKLTIKTLLMEYAIKTQNEAKCREYGIDGLRSWMSGHENHQFLHSLVRMSFSIIQSFTNEHFFKQAQHIIAVVNYRVLNFRRSLPPKERTTVNPIQHDAAFLYAEFGNRLVRKSQELILEKRFRQGGVNLVEGHKNFHHDEYERLMPHLPELKQFEKQYPIQLTLDSNEYKKMQKKIRQWLDRMKFLKQTSTAPHGLCMDTWPAVIERLDIIDSASTMPDFS